MNIVPARACTPTFGAHDRSLSAWCVECADRPWSWVCRWRRCGGLVRWPSSLAHRLASTGVEAW